MKKNSKLFWVLLVVMLLSLSLVFGCKGGGDDGDDDVIDNPTGFTQYLDWTIVTGWENNYDAEKLKIEMAQDGSNRAMKVTWGTSAVWKACDLYADLPAGVDYGDYDGISFKLKTHVIQGNNFNFQFKATYGGEEVYFLAGDGHEWLASTDTWVTVTRPFSGYAKTDWSGTYSGTLKQFLTDTMDTTQRIYISPILNHENPTLVNEDIVIYLDNIGFYKGSTSNVTVIWNFED